MNIEFLSGFERDLSQTRDKKLANIILDCIHRFEEANQMNYSGAKPRSIKKE
jgi:hypothetical protein